MDFNCDKSRLKKVMLGEISFQPPMAKGPQMTKGPQSPMGKGLQQPMAQGPQQPRVNRNKPYY